MEFEKIALKHKKQAEACLCATPYGISESSFTSLFLWSEVYHTELAFQEDLLFVRTGAPGKYKYLLPMGCGDLKRGLELICEDAAEQGITPMLIAVTDHMRERLESIVPNTFDYEPARDSFDYIYDPQELAELPGKKFHQKRNHVNRFCKEYEGRYRFESISTENLAEVLAFQKWWYQENRERVPEIETEHQMLLHLFEHYFELGLIGGLIRIDGAVCAYSIGTRLCKKTVLVQVEKGNIDYHGIYQIMNQQFVRNLCMDAMYINREDDAGVEGLRKAKLSYQPKFLMRKYVATWKR